MSTTRLMRAWRPSSAICAPSYSQKTLTSMQIKCMSSNAMGFSLENNRLAGDGERKPVVLVKATTCSKAAVNVAVAAATKTSQGVDVATLVAIVRTAVARRLLLVTRSRSWKSIVQLFIEKAIIDCRFFTMFAVAGSLLGSVLCFLEGTFLVLESYLHYFHSLSHHSDHGRIMHLLIESLDMFLIGTAMLVFGMGLHVMFVGSQSLRSQGSQLPSSNFLGNFYLKEMPSWVGMKSVTQAKSMIGYALMLLLQVGVLEKFKSVPLVTGLDLACFAGAVFVSSAGLFILSKLSLER
ncbi:hypothetical protein L2E82_27041 [Cichorium intybus]|uniref:Uncharacterized protein n=1 Tax=Cichorium intybus TaxID=13427 RepID=A0ACB9CS52_CICIN|nr:hypothetical protein L2E82_27041 [Cichorium intybus]